MEIIYSANSCFEKDKLYLALGNFDGIHRGHQAVIRSAVKRARAAGGTAAVLLFEPHPSILLHPDRPFCLLTGMEERAALMAELGLDCLFVEPFTARTASLSPEDFVRSILLQKFGISGVSIGDDYSFGRGGAGGEELMRHYGESAGFDVMVCPMEEASGVAISSSAIKKLLEKGAVEQAALLLNYYFHRRGKIVPGHGRGGKLLYPTANMIPSPLLVWPGPGVYLTAVGGLGQPLCYGLTNVGPNPTFRDSAFSVETHILDFQGNLYGREIGLYFLTRLRDTRSFSSPRLLREQIGDDINRGREIARERFGLIGCFVEPPRFIRPPARADARLDNPMPGGEI